MAKLIGTYLGIEFYADESVPPDTVYMRRPGELGPRPGETLAEYFKRTVIVKGIKTVATSGAK